MDPIIGGALISGASSLLGGIFGRNSERKAIAAQNEYNKPINIRARAEEAGFNPLAFIGPGVGQQTATGGTNYMGAALADAGLMLGDAIAKKGEATALTALQKQNKELADKVQSLTLRPKVGGVYARRQAVPTTAQALGASGETTVSTVARSNSANAAPDGAAVSARPDNLRPLAESSIVDPRRPVDNADIKTSSGFMVVDNPYLPFSLYAPTLDGDEPLQWYDLPSLIPAATIGAGVYAYEKGRDFGNERWKRKLIESYKPKPTKRERRPPLMGFDPQRERRYQP